MISNVILRVVLGWVRHAMTVIGGVYLAKGYFTEDQLNDIIGGVVTLIAVVWSLIDKIKAEKKLRATAAGGAFNPNAEVRKALPKDK